MTRARLRWLLPTLLWIVTAVGITITAIEHNTPYPGWFVVFVATGISAVFFTADAVGLTEARILAPREPAEDRVQRLVAALSESTKVMAEIEREVKARGELARRLQEDVERHRELLALNRDEVEAVAQTMGQEVRREGRRSLWVGVAVNALFFALGVAATLLLGH